MSHKHLIRPLLMVAVVLAGLLLGPVLIDGLALVVSPSHALAVAPQQIDPASPDAPTGTLDCNIREIGAFSNRIHVRCWNGAGAIQYFATPTSDAQKSARMLSLLLTASAAGKHVFVAYSDTPDASYGCQAGDCRPIIHLLLLD